MIDDCGEMTAERYTDPQCILQLRSVEFIRRISAVSPFSLFSSSPCLLKRYTVVENNNIVFSSDSLDELKVWLDALGFSLGRLIYDSYAFTPKGKTNNYGAMRTYELRTPLPKSSKI